MFILTFYGKMVILMHSRKRFRFQLPQVNKFQYLKFREKAVIFPCPGVNIPFFPLSE